MNSSKSRSAWEKGRWPLLCSFVCLIFWLLSGLGTGGSFISWYSQLSKPAGTPPGWVFGPVWAVLYVVMGIAWGRLIDQKAWLAVGLFGFQFLMNLLWTPMFFGAHLIGVALGVVCTLWVGLLLTLLLARKSDRLSAWLLAPYLAWVTFAIYLNAGIFWLNR